MRWSENTGEKSSARSPHKTGKTTGESLVALGEITPTAAIHIARVSGEARFLLAWVALDHNPTVREVRAVASDVNDGESVETAFPDAGVKLGRVDVTLPPDVYRELRRRAGLDGEPPDTIVTEALDEYFSRSE